MTTARVIAEALAKRAGLRAIRLGDGSFLAPCPVPTHGKGRGDRRPSLQISNGHTRVLFHCHGGCDRIEVINEVRGQGLLDDGERGYRPPSPTAPPKASPPDNHEQRQHEKAAWLWSQRRPIVGTIGDRYLRGARGISCPLPATLGFLPGRGEYPPAMIAAYALPEPGALGEPRNVRAVHITRLLCDGSDRDRSDGAKITIGRPLDLPIVVSPMNDLLGLAVTEGIEDGLTVYQLTGMGVWVAGSAGRMPALAPVIPWYVEAVTIYAHDDGGRHFALNLADALASREINIRIEGLDGTG